MILGIIFESSLFFSFYDEKWKLISPGWIDSSGTNTSVRLRASAPCLMGVDKGVEVWEGWDTGSWAGAPARELSKRLLAGSDWGEVLVSIWLIGTFCLQYNKNQISMQHLFTRKKNQNFIELQNQYTLYLEAWMANSWAGFAVVDFVLTCPNLSFPVFAVE